MPSWPIKDIPVAIIDNNRAYWGRMVDGIPVYAPDDLPFDSYDLIILMSDYAFEMRSQLIEYGCPKEKMIHYLDFFGGAIFHKKEFLAQEEVCKKKKVLIFTNKLGYHGGAITAYMTAMALKNENYHVTIVASEVDSVFAEEILEAGIHIFQIENVEHLSEELLSWVNFYDYILVNTFPMVCCAVRIAKSKKVLLWLHENLDAYEKLEFWREEISEGINSENITICAVSEIAQNNFLLNYTYRKRITIMPYGIEDGWKKRDLNDLHRVKFAIIGNIIFRKGQDLLLEAIRSLPEEYCNQCEFYFIGKPCNDEYSLSVMKGIQNHSCCKYLGELKQEELRGIYPQLDVLVVASRAETMSLIATEGMMFGKTCIISDSAGMAGYISNKENGLIFQNEDIFSLCEAIKWCCNNRYNLKSIGEKARRVYENEFSMRIFTEKLIENIRLMEE